MAPSQVSKMVVLMGGLRSFHRNHWTPFHQKGPIVRPSPSPSLQLEQPTILSSALDTDIEDDLVEPSPKNEYPSHVYQHQQQLLAVLVGPSITKL